MDFFGTIFSVVIVLFTMIGSGLFIFWLLAFRGVNWWTAIVPGSDIAIVGRGEKLARVITPDGWEYDLQNDEIITVAEFKRRYPGRILKKPVMDYLLNPLGVNWVSILFPALALLLFEIHKKRIKSSGIPKNADIDAYIEVDENPYLTPFFHFLVEFPIVLKDVRTKNNFDVEMLLRILCRVVKPNKALIMLRNKAIERVSSAVAAHANDLVSKEYDYEKWNMTDVGKGSEFSAKFRGLNADKTISGVAVPGTVNDAGLEVVEVWVEVWKDGPDTKEIRQANQAKEKELLLAKAETAKQEELKMARQHQADGNRHLAKVDPAVVIAAELMEVLKDSNAAAMVAAASAQRDGAVGFKGTVYSPGGGTIPMVQVPLTPKKDTSTPVKPDSGTPTVKVEGIVKT